MQVAGSPTDWQISVRSAARQVALNAQCRVIEMLHQIPLAEFASDKKYGPQNDSLGNFRFPFAARASISPWAPCKRRMKSDWERENWEEERERRDLDLDGKSLPNRSAVRACAVSGVGRTVDIAALHSPHSAQCNFVPKRDKQRKCRYVFRVETSRTNHDTF